mgnify:CR=1 FL=1
MEFMELFPWGVAIVNIIGCFLNARKKIGCWPIWIGTAILNSWYFAFYRPNYGIALIWVSYLFFDVYGWIKWRKNESI